MNNLFNSLIYSAKRTYKLIFITLFLSLSILLVGLLVARFIQQPFSDLTRDATAVLRGNPMVGIISNLGFVIWISSGFLGLFIYFNIYKSGISPITKKLVLFSAIIVLILGFDDMIMFHEEIFPNLFFIDEKFLYVLYFAMIIIYIIYFFNELVKSTYINLLIIGFSFFALSVLTDALFDKNVSVNDDLHFFFEDGFKFIGIIFWSVFNIFLFSNLINGALNKKDN